ncbi:MAG: 1,6-anhydro-N-acetylmuramyl-L-alanine amidase AmpD [Gammaproteobacteria bacterium]|nr:1,6-anhydro-N-acetylmuramyl-L-alanine amidase AmpD [Gammaproteobacteria bacterium]
MHVDPESGLISPARFVGSPNFDTRPDGCVPEVLIIHAISLPPRQFGGPYVEQLFCNCLDVSHHEYFREIQGLEVSSHLFIRRDGELIQFVPLGQRAWHAGVSECEGRQRVNDFSIGIELEGDDFTPFEEAQYECLAGVTRALMDAYPDISVDRIYGHADIAPTRKTDPGPYFDWQRYRSRCSA